MRGYIKAFILMIVFTVVMSACGAVNPRDVDRIPRSAPDTVIITTATVTATDNAVAETPIQTASQATMPEETPDESAVAPVTNTTSTHPKDEENTVVGETRLIMLETSPAILVQAIGYEPVKCYQDEKSIYFLTYTGLKDPVRTLETRLNGDGVCSEVWRYDLKTGETKQLFVLFREQSIVGTLFSIDRVDEKGTLFFTETWNGNQQNMTVITREYLPAEDILRTLSYVPGSPEVLTTKELEAEADRVIQTDTLKWYRKIASVVNSGSGSIVFQSMIIDEKLYGTRYNQHAETGAYYHEAVKYDLNTDTCSPIVRRILKFKGEVSLFEACPEENSGKFLVAEWTPLEEGNMKYQSFIMDPIQRTVISENGQDVSGNFIFNLEQ